VERLLRETDLTIDVIARQTGFAHSHYLQAAFKQTYGQTPGAFRRAGTTIVKYIARQTTGPRNGNRI
jgi:AraC-like DNA-binding protein